jgi:15-hydroxyprostaglandin dehydrogenase (NAD)
MSTVLKAFDTVLSDDAMTGQTVELSLDQLYFRNQPEWANESQRWLGEDSSAFWEEAYKSNTVTKDSL